MTRRIASLVIVALALAVSLVGIGGSTLARANGVATVSPASGSANDLFSFSVSGLTPGNTVRISITDSAGSTFQLVDSGGNFLVLIVQSDGTVVDSLTPAVDTPNAAPGAWTATFEEIETGANTTIAFTVTS